MKKLIIKTLMVTVLFVVNTLTVNANSNVSVKGPSSLYVGNSGTITISVPKGFGFEVDIKTESKGVKLSTEKIIKWDANSATVTVTAVGVDNAIIVLSGETSDGGDPVPFTVNHRINITNKPAPKPIPPKPDFVPPVKDNTEEEKKPALTEEQKKKIAAEKAAKEEAARLKELEEAKKVPLIKDISITSLSQKMNNQNIGKITLEKDKFEYEITIPKKIDKVGIEVPSVDGVTSVYNNEVSILDSEESKTIEIILKSKNYDQLIKLKINRDTTPDLIRQYKDSNDKLSVYFEAPLKSFFEKYDFATKTDDKVGSYFSNELISFQLLSVEDSKLKVFLLDDNLELQEEVSILITKNNELFFINETLGDTNIYGESKTKISFDRLIDLGEIDNSLAVSTEVLGWELEEGLIVEGYTSDGESSMYLISEDNVLTKVIVPKTPQKSTDYVKIGLAVALTALAATNIIYFAVGYARKRKYDY